MSNLNLSKTESKFFKSKCLNTQISLEAGAKKRNWAKINDKYSDIKDGVLFTYQRFFHP